MPKDSIIYLRERDTIQIKIDFKPFISLALDVKQVPSSPTLRQRFNGLAQQKSCLSILLEESTDLLNKLDVTLTPVEVGGDEKSTGIYRWILMCHHLITLIPRRKA